MFSYSRFHLKFACDPLPCPNCIRPTLTKHFQLEKKLIRFLDDSETFFATFFENIHFQRIFINRFSNVLPKFYQNVFFATEMWMLEHHFVARDLPPPQQTFHVHLLLQKVKTVNG